MRTDATISRLSPVVEEIMENNYARQQLQSGAENLRDAYNRAQKRRVKPTEDRKLHRQLQSGISSLGEGAKALAGGRRAPKRRWPKRLATVGILAGGAGAVAYFLNKSGGDVAEVDSGE
ncbi:MAG TPA: hypothetical protein VIT85_07870 [Solirubrobacterales bacterium]